ncbi:MAG TPA: chemotaxis protein CheB [Candidatus Binatia bacterium]|jgi:two-component system CheB/CheR fusion protein|nr:chemotaxis protein CheB [Candidatus Binatia bacterium]
MDDRSPEPSPTSLLVLGCGASAGGLDALSQLIAGIPPDTGVAVVIVQHMAPEQDSLLPALLQSHTTIPVTQVSGAVVLEPNHIYVNPPNAQLELRGDTLQCVPRPADASQHHPIDHFFRTLAEDAGHRALAVVLSGTGADGADGLCDVKAAGGITLAQDPDTARFDGMPRAAVGTGEVDVVLPAADLGAEIARIAAQVSRRLLDDPLDDEQSTPVARSEQLLRIFGMLRTATGVDFRHYKLATIERRLQRRLVLHRLTRLDEYLPLLRDTPDEVQALYRDILIHVTRFFREPQSFAALAEHVLPRVFDEHRDGAVRAWVVGCATGEEAYSLAIAMIEYLEGRGDRTPIQIFATDVSEDAVQRARIGLYPPSIAADVSPERLRRFFTKVDGGYRISKIVRDLCVFARQDITRDPPFSKLDLILCRNVLIYLQAGLQSKLLGVFHYALTSSRFLMLGHAETIGTHTDLFELLDRRHRLYVRKATHRIAIAGFPLAARSANNAPPPRPTALAREDTRAVQNEANRVLLDRYSPPGVVVDADLQITHFRGQTGPYLEPASGDPSLSLFKMARDGLLLGLREAIDDVRRTNRPARREALRVERDGAWRSVDVEVLPLQGSSARHLLVLFESSVAPPAARTVQPLVEPTAVSPLAEELAASRNYLQSVVQELEAANEELQSANEEILSSNEELQSTNEELDTAKEELQSTNEELNTVNEELRERNEELSRVNSDLLNILGSVRIAILIVSTDLRIRRFTPMAERVLNLLPGDIGRPIGHIVPDIDCPDLERLIREAIDTVAMVEREVQDRAGTWYALRIRPYKSTDNRIDGAVLALFDIDEVRRREDELRAIRRYVDAMTETLGRPVVILDVDLHVRLANPAFLRTFALDDADVVGRHLYTLHGGAWDMPLLRQHLDGGVRADGRHDGVAIEQDFPGVGRLRLLLNVRRIESGGGSPTLVLMTFDVPPR